MPTLVTAKRMRELEARLTELERLVAEADHRFNLRGSARTREQTVYVGALR